MKLLDKLLRRSRDSTSTIMGADHGRSNPFEGNDHNNLSTSTPTETRSTPRDQNNPSPIIDGCVLRYHPFTHKDEIRLIVLHAGDFSSPIFCSLIHVQLDANPLYDALSYVWGSEQDTDVVYVNHSDHLVGKNLFLALQHLRLESEDRFIWIDALCINQLDDRERGHQVAQMGVIYSHAAIVRIWLGLSGPYTEATFAVIVSMYQANQHSVYFDSVTRREFISLCSRPYWGRLWIIQEVVLASKIEIHCGRLQTPWEPFGTVCFENSEASDEINDSNVWNLCRQRLSAKKGLSDRRGFRVSLLYLLQMHIQAQCADVRDKAYGLHSFAPECCRIAIPVDYSCSAYELCGRILEHEILNHIPYMGDGGGAMKASAKLHHLMVHGAVRQQNSRMAFNIGNCGDHIPQSAGLPTRAYASGKDIGKVVWVSPRLSEIWNDGRNFEVPTQIFSLAGQVDRLKSYPIRHILQSHGSPITTPRASEGPVYSGEPLEMMSLPKYEGSTSNLGSSDNIWTTLQDFLACVQTETRSEECFIAMGKTSTESLFLFHTQARVESGDSILGITGTDVFAILPANTEHVIGRAVFFDSNLAHESLLGFSLNRKYPRFVFDISTALALSQVLV